MHGCQDNNDNNCWGLNVSGVRASHEKDRHRLVVVGNKSTDYRLLISLVNLNEYSVETTSVVHEQ